MCSPAEPRSVFGKVWVMEQGERLWLLKRASRVIMRLLRACFWAVGSRGALLGLAGSHGSFPGGSSLLVGWRAGTEGAREGGRKGKRLDLELNRTGDGRASISGLLLSSAWNCCRCSFAHAHCDVLLMYAASNVEGGCGRCNILFDIYCISERPIVLQFGGQHTTDYHARMHCRDVH